MFGSLEHFVHLFHTWENSPCSLGFRSLSPVVWWTIGPELLDHLHLSFGISEKHFGIVWLSLRAITVLESSILYPRRSLKRLNESCKFIQGANSEASIQAQTRWWQVHYSFSSSPIPCSTKLIPSLPCKKQSGLKDGSLKKKKKTSPHQIHICTLTSIVLFFGMGEVGLGFLATFCVLSVRYQAPWKTL